MKKIKILSILFVFTIVLNLNSINKKIIFLDTNNLESYKYHNFFELAKTANFKIDFKSFADLLDKPIKDLSSYDGLFLNIGIEFLKGIAIRSELSIKFLQILKNFAEQKNKLIGLFLTPIINNNIHNKTLLYAPLFNCFGVNVSANNFYENNNVVDMQEFRLINNFLSDTLESKSLKYQTTLTEPKNTLKNSTIKNINLKTITTLPINTQSLPEIKYTLPYGIYWNKNNNHIFISSNSLLSFSGITENFHICPMDFNLRQEMHKKILDMLVELRELTNTKTINYELIKQIKYPELPKNIKNIGSKTINLEKSKRKIIAWTDINVFEKSDKKYVEQQDKLINYILKTSPRMDLWITLNPNMYFSPIAKKKNNLNIYINSIKKFTKKLSILAKKLNLKTPNILIGFEIANNLYAPDLPKNKPIDIYGNEYYDIPSPIEFSFWNNEIIKTLNLFLKEWSKPEINNNIKISGVVIDLEMYCRRTSSNFLDTMCFNNLNIKKFGKNSLKELIDSKNINNYFKFLKSQAENIAIKIKNNINKNIKNATIACYAPNISTDWFYLGFYKGLSSKEKNIKLLTFNSESESLQNWLLNKDIFLEHLSVLMLSKIKTSDDFGLLNEISKHNHGVWLNKFSRFAETLDPNNLEQSQMNLKDRLEFFKIIKTYN
ncbi:hypothetical protein KJ644_03465 [Candidatus Dependentiae bacterium]|nr:hypothetical protein [Candidatus Dependentiae bacterium]MBU4387505.1 hypothetical protein [Candidatus Dependentiae bacterium]MCG2756309.1 hypothetical protein [Candidatus Dependentiae bacterium]